MDDGKLQDEQPLTGSTGRLIKGIRHTETSVLLARCR